MHVIHIFAKTPVNMSSLVQRPDSWNFRTVLSWTNWFDYLDFTVLRSALGLGLPDPRGRPASSERADRNKRSEHTPLILLKPAPLHVCDSTWYFFLEAVFVLLSCTMCMWKGADSFQRNHFLVLSCEKKRKCSIAWKTMMMHVSSSGFPPLSSSLCQLSPHKICFSPFSIFFSLSSTALATKGIFFFICLWEKQIIVVGRPNSWPDWRERWSIMTIHESMFGTCGWGVPSGPACWNKSTKSCVI